MPLSLGTIKVTLKCKTIIRVQIDFDAIVRKRWWPWPNYIFPKNTQRKEGTVINVNPKIEERTKAGICVCVALKSVFRLLSGQCLNLLVLLITFEFFTRYLHASEPIRCFYTFFVKQREAKSVFRLGLLPNNSVEHCGGHFLYFYRHTESSWYTTDFNLFDSRRRWAAPFVGIILNIFSSLPRFFAHYLSCLISFFASS